MGSPNPAEIYFSDSTSSTGVVAANNLAAGASNNVGFNRTTGTGSTFIKNLVVDNGGATPFFTNPAATDYQLTATGSSAVINQGDTANAHATDIGFDPKCVTQTAATPPVGQAISWWSYYPDYNYIASVGGVAGCFHPAVRPQVAGPDIGAYEYGGLLSDAGAGSSSGGSSGSSSSSGGGGARGRIEQRFGGRIDRQLGRWFE